jgi:hypothetical protein
MAETASPQADNQDYKKNLLHRLERLRALLSRLEAVRAGERRNELLIDELRVAIADVRRARSLVAEPLTATRSLTVWRGKTAEGEGLS